MALLFSVNALANEFRLDRRTVERRLRDVPPAEERVFEDRTERRWRLADVAHYLQAEEMNPEADATALRLVGAIKDAVAQTLYPGLLESKEFAGVILGFARRELQASESQVQRLHQVLALALAKGISEAFKDDEMKFTLPGGWEAVQTSAPDHGGKT
jgi:hypothetical protein